MGNKDVPMARERGPLPQVIAMRARGWPCSIRADQGLWFAARFLLPLIATGLPGPAHSPEKILLCILELLSKRVPPVSFPTFTFQFFPSLFQSLSLSLFVFRGRGAAWWFRSYLATGFQSVCVTALLMFIA